MPAPVGVVLNEEEDRRLSELRLATTVPQRTRDRAHMVRLNAQGWKRTRHSQKHKQDRIAKGIKQADLNTLKIAAQEGHIVLKYLDESGFCLWSPVSYSYSRMGEQKCLGQTPQRFGRRVSILGLWQPDEHFDYALAQGGFKTQSYLMRHGLAGTEGSANVGTNGSDYRGAR